MALCSRYSRNDALLLIQISAAVVSVTQAQRPPGNAAAAAGKVEMTSEHLRQISAALPSPQHR